MKNIDISSIMEYKRKIAKVLIIVIVKKSRNIIKILYAKSNFIDNLSFVVVLSLYKIIHNLSPVVVSFLCLNSMSI